MDVREKLVELIAQKVCETWSRTCDQWMPHDCGKCYANDCHISEIADYLIRNGVTVQEWISVEDRLPDENHDGSVNAVLVTDGFVQHMAYFTRGEWRFAESGEIKEPMWYRITHWMPLPQPPKGE